MPGALVLSVFYLVRRVWCPALVRWRVLLAAGGWAMTIGSPAAVVCQRNKHLRAALRVGRRRQKLRAPESSRLLPQPKIRASSLAWIRAAISCSSRCERTTHYGALARDSTLENLKCHDVRVRVPPIIRASSW
jgi:hypothetical protein